MQETCGNIKTILADMQGKGLSSTAKLVAILEACGIDSKDDLAALLEIGHSTLRTARAALKNERSKMSTARNQALENEHERSKMSETLENERQNSSVPSRAHATKESLRDTSLSVSQSADPTELMIDDVLAFMGPIAQRHEAAKWLTGTISAFGPERTSRAWTIITAKRAAREAMPNPLALWSKTAQGMTSAPAKPSNADVLPFKVTTPMHLKPKLEVANA